MYRGVAVRAASKHKRNVKMNNKETRLKLYYVAFAFYAMAPICLLILIVDMLTVEKTGLFFWALFLFGCFPSMLVGFVLSLTGWRVSSKRKSSSNIVTGRIATFVGAAGMIAGLLGWGLLYVVVGCKSQQVQTVEQKKDIVENRSVYAEAAVEIEHFNEIENDTTHWVAFEADYDFEQFPTEIFTGDLAEIDLTDGEYIKDAGVNFGGHYTIIHKSCGSMCERICVTDRISGYTYDWQDINLTTPENRDGKWSYLYKPDSKMLIANYWLFTSDEMDCYTGVYGIAPEFYLWTGRSFKRIQ